MTTSDHRDAALRAELFFVADHAAVESGKLYCSGGCWDRIGLPEFPAVHHFSVAAVLNIPWHAYNQSHSFTIWFEDADGNRHGAEVAGDFEVAAAPDMKVGDPTRLPFAGTFNNFEFPQPNDYAAVMEVDGTEVARWSFRVSLAGAATV